MYTEDRNCLVSNQRTDSDTNGFREQIAYVN